MKPLAILQFDGMNHPSEFGAFMQARQVPICLLRLDLGAKVPEKAHEYCAYCLLGGPMMVGDDVPWMQPVLRLVDAAMQADIPVIGHCLGAQLMAHVLGASVAPHPYPQIGWDVLQLESNAIAHQWFGEDAGNTVPVAHWHIEAFEIPHHATRIGTHPYSPSQAFALGPHLAFQPHIELNAQNFLHWFKDSGRLRERYPQGSIQELEEVQATLPQHLPRMQTFARSIYTKWLEGVLVRQTLTTP
jgi:GMP synthase-like glutamine amidotransferase